MVVDKTIRSDDEDFVEKTVLVNPNVIENYWKKGKRPLCYFKRWRRLNLSTAEYDFIRVYRSLEANSMDELWDAFDKNSDTDNRIATSKNDEEGRATKQRSAIRELARRARDDFDALSEKERSDFRSVHLSYVKSAGSRETLGLVGWADIEPIRTIEVFSVGAKQEEDTTKYRRRFDRMKFSIQERDDDAVGSLMHWTETLRQYDEDDPGEDYLIAEMYVKVGMLAALEQEIRQRGRKVPLSIAVEAHLFQYEVEEGLAEPYHFQLLNMVYDSACSIILNFIRIGTTPRPQDNREQDEFLLDDKSPATAGVEIQSWKELLNAVSSVSLSIREVKMALWVLALLLFLSLFV